MKTKIFAFAACAACAIASAATADMIWDPDADQVYNLGMFTLSGGAGGPTNEFEYVINTTGTSIVGFSFLGVYSEAIAGSWASDTRLRIYLNGDEIAHIGGFTGAGSPWDFQGSLSNAPGAYAHGINGSSPNGDGNPDWSLKALATGDDEWRFVFTNGYHSSFTGDLTWSDAQIIIHHVPAPGALALLGLAGLAGVRRRRA